jgi:hypothetical protein
VCCSDEKFCNNTIHIWELEAGLKGKEPDKQENLVTGFIKSVGIKRLPTLR